MSTINAPSLLTPSYSGECPLAKAHGAITLAAAQIGDKVRLSKVYAGTKVYAADLVFDKLAATGATVSLGYEFVNGEAAAAPTAFINATDVATAAGTVKAVVRPVVLPYDAYIIATIGGAACTGGLDSIITYEYQGK